MRALMALIKRDLRLSVVKGSGAFVTLFFFLAVVCLFPLALGGQEYVLRPLATGIVWVAVVLASLLSLESLYHRDEEDGNMEMLVLSPVDEMGVMLAKVVAHWLVSGLLLLAAAGVAAPMLFIPAGVMPVLFASLLLGTLYMSVMGGLGAVVTLGAKRPGLLLAVLILPLYVPMLILGTLAVEASFQDMPVRPYLLWQGAMVAAGLPFSLWAGAALLRAGVRT